MQGPEVTEGPSGPHDLHPLQAPGVAGEALPQRADTLIALRGHGGGGMASHWGDPVPCVPGNLAPAAHP